MEHTHFEIYADTAGLWRWRLVAGNGKIVADSGEGYATHDNVVRALNDLPTWVLIAREREPEFVAS